MRYYKSEALCGSAGWPRPHVQGYSVPSGVPYLLHTCGRTTAQHTRHTAQFRFLIATTNKEEVLVACEVNKKKEYNRRWNTPRSAPDARRHPPFGSADLCGEAVVVVAALSGSCAARLLHPIVPCGKTTAAAAV